MTTECINQAAGKSTLLNVVSLGLSIAAGPMQGQASLMESMGLFTGSMGAAVAGRQLALKALPAPG